MNIGIDLHDTLTYAPEFFINLIKIWPHKKFIITGTPANDREFAIQILQKHNITLDMIDGLLMGYQFDRNSMDINHFNNMAQHKLKLLQDNNISIYFDDNPFYAKYMKDHNIIMFQTIVSKEYLDLYKLKDSYFSCHLQEKQFSFLDNIDNKSVKK